MFDTKITVDVSALERLTRQYPRESKAARTAKMTEAVNLLEAAIKKKAPYGAGPIHLRDTIHGKVKTMTDRVTGMVGTPAKYGEAVESGTKPHFPPVGPIQFWVERMLGYRGDDAASVAFLIARAISKRGTKGAHMFEKTFQEREAQVIRILNEIPDDIIRRLQQ
jgi:hypothetical protein